MVSHDEIMAGKLYFFLLFLKRLGTVVQYLGSKVRVKVGRDLVEICWRELAITVHVDRLFDSMIGPAWYELMATTCRHSPRERWSGHAIEQGQEPCTRVTRDSPLEIPILREVTRVVRADVLRTPTQFVGGRYGACVPPFYPFLE